MLAPAKRANWDEVELGFDDATARAEAAALLQVQPGADHRGHGRCRPSPGWRWMPRPWPV
jgi:hypothetical protein